MQLTFWTCSVIPKHSKECHFGAMYSTEASWKHYAKDMNKWFSEGKYDFMAFHKISLNLEKQSYSFRTTKKFYRQAVDVLEINTIAKKGRMRKETAVPMLQGDW